MLLYVCMCVFVGRGGGGGRGAESFSIRNANQLDKAGNESSSVSVKVCTIVLN